MRRHWTPGRGLGRGWNRPRDASGSGARGPGGGGDQGRRGGRVRRAGGGLRRPAPYLVEFILSCDPQLRVDGAFQRLDDPVEVHLPGRGLGGPRASRPDCSFSFSFDPLSLLLRDPCTTSLPTPRHRRHLQPLAAPL